MTPENLERHTKLQPLYRKMMGEWQEGDKGYYMGAHCYMIKLLMRHESKEGIEHIMQFVCHGNTFNLSLFDKTIRRLPLLIDPVNPKRGLWGMVDWSKLRYEQWGPDGEIAIFKLPFIHFNEEMGIPIKDHPFIVGDPETALLKALCEQEWL